MIQCQRCTCAGWLWEGEGGLDDHQPGVYVPLKALFLVVPIFNNGLYPINYMCNVTLNRYHAEIYFFQ